MKMFKRITATLVLIFSLSSVLAREKSENAVESRYATAEESKYEKAVEYVRDNIKSPDPISAEERTYDKLFHEKNTLVIDDRLWCYKGEKSTPLLLGHVPGNKDMKAGDVFKIQNDAPFFAFVFEPTYKRWAEIKADLPGWKNSSERFCELLGIERNFDEPLEIAIYRSKC